MTELVLIGHRATRTARVLWMLEELGQPFTYREARPHSEDVEKKNPSGKVPVLLVEGETLTDSTAIMSFLTDRAGRFTRPCGSIERARQDGLTHLVLDEFDAVLWVAGRHSYVLPEELRVAGVKDAAKWEFERNQKRLAERLGDGPFLMGEDMTVPDIILAHCLGWAVKAEFTPLAPELAAFLERMRARPAYARAMAH